MTRLSSATRLLAALVVGCLVGVLTLVAPAASAKPLAGPYQTHTSTTTKVKLTKHNVKVGTKLKATFVVRTRKGKLATGTIKVKISGHGTVTVTLVDGRATFKLPTDEAGKFKITATYGGDDVNLGSRGKATYHVKSAKKSKRAALALSSAESPASGNFNPALLGLLGAGLLSSAAVSTLVNRRRRSVS